MAISSKMTALERRAAITLAGIFGLRLFGMFVVLPVFAIFAAGLPGGDDLRLVGLAVGAYGLTQALLQLPFGWWSDKVGRKPVIYAGLMIFAAGSFLAAMADNIYVVIFGRALQGAGAISAVVIALVSDLTRDEQRPKAMAVIGSAIGAMFVLSLVIGPWLAPKIGVSGLFALTGFLALVAFLVAWRIVPDPPAVPKVSTPGIQMILETLRNRQLQRLNFGIFSLHAVLTALFIVIPFALRDAGIPVEAQWKIYLPVMLGSFVLMLIPVMQSSSPVAMMRWFRISVALLLLLHVLLPWMVSNILWLAVFLVGFFTAFNVLEAKLPALVSRLAPAGARGTATGIYSTVQFLGSFAGATAAGFLYTVGQVKGVVIFDAVLLAIWLILSFGQAGAVTTPPQAARQHAN
jgi:MFS family permease